MRDLVDATNTWCDPKVKANYLQFLSPHLSRAALQLLGCHCSWRSHRTSKLWRINHDTIAKFAPNFGRPPLDESIFNAVYDFLVEHSRVAANKVSIKHGVPFRHLNDSVSQLFTQYESLHHVPSALRLCESKFVEYTKEMQIFTDPTRDSDMCGHCERFRQLRRRITALDRSYKEHRETLARSGASSGPSDDVSSSSSSDKEKNDVNQTAHRVTTVSVESESESEGGSLSSAFDGGAAPRPTSTAPACVATVSVERESESEAESSEFDDEAAPTSTTSASTRAATVSGKSERESESEAESSEFDGEAAPTSTSAPRRAATVSAESKSESGSQSSEFDGDAAPTSTTAPMRVSSSDSEDDDIDVGPSPRTANKAKHRGPPSRAAKPESTSKQRQLYIQQYPERPNITRDDAKEIARIQQFDVFELKRFVRHHSSLTTEEKTSWIRFLDEYATLSEHRHYAKKVNNVYYQQATKTPPNHMIFTMDFKMNIAIGNKVIELSSDYRKKKARTVLGFMACTSTARKYIDYVSDVRSHTGFFVKQCLRDLFHRQWFVDWLKRDNIHTLVTWADNAGHFKTHSTLYMILSELLYEFELFRNIKASFFVAFHGKSFVDGHFGLFSTCYETYCSTNRDGIHDTQKLCDVINEFFVAAATAKIAKRKHNKLSTIMKRRALNDSRPLTVEAINFDINRSDVRFTSALRMRQSNTLDLERRLVVPDIKSWGFFHVQRRAAELTAYDEFKHDPRYHRCVRHKKKRRKGKGQKSKASTWMMRQKSDIEARDKEWQGADDTLAKWCNRVAQVRSGHVMEVRVNDTPADRPETAVPLICHLSVSAIPAVKMCKSPECDAAKTCELDRKQRARAKYRRKNRAS